MYDNVKDTIQYSTIPSVRFNKQQLDQMRRTTMTTGIMETTMADTSILAGAVQILLGSLPFLRT
jgi:exosome complex RNA-binding protein Rrp42 (RNase PH superfamily)